MLEKINEIESKISTTLKLLNDAFINTKDQSKKEEIKEIIKIQIGYSVFLNELKEHYNNKELKNTSKEFIVSQLSKIIQTCKLIETDYLTVNTI